MRVARIYTQQELHAGAHVGLEQAASRHLRQVLRLRVGQTVVLFDGSGYDYEAELTDAEGQNCTLQVLRLASTEPEPEPALSIHLGLGVSRGERMDFAVQKSVELGVGEITPLFSSRSMVRLDADRRDKRIAHWQGVIRGACEQSGRSRLPRLHPPTTLADWLGEHRGGLLLYHGATDTLTNLPRPDAPLNLLIGPEGGLSESERNLALDAGFNPVRLGPRILRTETAPIAALAAIQVLWGDFR